MSLNLDSQEKLTREQLKNVFGGNIASTDPGGEGKNNNAAGRVVPKKVYVMTVLLFLMVVI